MPDHLTAVQTALGDKYDPKASYVVVRPSMVGTAKYAMCERVGEYDEDTRNGTKLVILKRPPPPPTPPPAPPTRSRVTQAATDRVREVLGRSYGTGKKP